MTLILRKCWKDGSSRNGFKYGQVGEKVVCPDWNPEPKCGNGLHGLKEGNGDWELLEGHDWLVIEVRGKIVDIDEDKCKFRTGKILFRGKKSELANSEFPNKLKLNENAAYNWAYYIGNQDIMINKIESEQYAHEWACHIGNKEEMKKKIKTSEWAYKWAIDIGNRDEMVEKINLEYYVHKFAVNIGYRDKLINKITESECAYYWARDIGNEDIMKPKVKELYWIDRWNFIFPRNKIER